MKAKLILPSLTEADSRYFRPIKYSLFPPIGLATLAAHFHEDEDVEIVDQHVESLSLDDCPDLVCIQVYITNAFRAYMIADHYRKLGVYVALGGLHVTSLPEEASKHADTILLGPGEETFPAFLNDFRKREPKPIYCFTDYVQTLDHLKPVRRD
ncbi:MAG: cobalamin-dependent protein [Bacteroidales bacterium]|nr:cobalamin-dependent protein [Bacteroidales bacterium]